MIIRAKPRKPRQSKAEKMQQTIEGMSGAKKAYYLAPQNFDPLTTAKDPQLKADLEAAEARREQGMADEF